MGGPQRAASDAAEGGTVVMEGGPQEVGEETVDNITLGSVFR